MFFIKLWLLLFNHTCFTFVLDATRRWININPNTALRRAKRELRRAESELKRAEREARKTERELRKLKRELR